MYDQDLLTSCDGARSRSCRAKICSVAVCIPMQKLMGAWPLTAHAAVQE